MGELAELYRYPLSGARGEVLESVVVTAAGLEGDHEYIAFDAAEYAFASSHIYRRIDQKSEAGARLAQVTAAWQQGLPQLTLTYQGETSPTFEIFEKPCSVDEFGDVTPCVQLGGAESEFMTYILGGRPTGLARKTPDWLSGAGGIAPGDRANAPVHIVNTDSVAAVRGIARSQGMAPFGAERFRPQLVVSGFEAFEEESWVGKDLHVGDVKLRVTRTTRRCKVTGRDQLTGVNLGDVPAILKQMTPAAGMRDFGVYAYPIDVTQDSRPTIHLGDCVELAV